MSDDLSPAEVKKLKSQFRSAGCSVKDLKDSTFEIIPDEFPVRTHVFANPYYIQLSTQILAKPKRIASLHEVRKFICDINLDASFIKFTLDEREQFKQPEAWATIASVKLVTGIAGGDYQATALKNLILLWQQDIANLMVSSKEFEIHPMMDEEKLRED
jgi:hypothetical protein